MKIQYLTMLIAGLALAAPAVTPAPEELSWVRRWTAAQFGESPPPAAGEAGIVVLANLDPVQKNGRAGRPMRIADREFRRGLYCHAESRLRVQLLEPARSFSALVGVDSNSQTSGGRGSVDFVVEAQGGELFRSGLMREGMAAKAVAVDLAGAKEFYLAVEATPDGISCDQADWAEAKVTLQSGREVWLAELPLRTPGAEVAAADAPPFRFRYDGKSSADFLSTWEVTADSRAADPVRDGAVRRERTWHDRRTGLEVRWVALEYADFPTVEWTVYFKNVGDRDTPPLGDIEALSARFASYGGSDYLLHHHKGTFVRADDFEPLTSRIKVGDRLRFAPPAGRPLGHVFPYFNLELQPDEGVIVVVGWPGQWSAGFERGPDGAVQVTAGQERVRVRLKPGEEIRTPLVVLQYWRGDWVRGQNVWRRWMLAHNIPRPDGTEPKPLLTPCSSHQFGEMIHANEENQKLFIDRYLEEKLGPDYWWMDAGWYVHGGGGWPRTGTWEVDRERFPNGLRAIADHAHARGVKTLLWFEPERVTPGTFLYTNNPAWLLGRDGEQKLLNLGHPEARAWITDHVLRTLTEQGIDLYRQDYNIDPLRYWREADAPDREGLTENHYVSGYLAFWDELRRRKPGLVIDTCASGGHRNDLETLRRALPFLRSDFILDAVGNQGHTYGLSFWFPYHGTGGGHLQSYELRSGMACPHYIGCWDVRNRSLDYDFLRRTVSQWRGYAGNYLGDYYPLTPYTTANDAWIGWQFHRPESDSGMVQVFRRTESVYEAARLKLRGLVPEEHYQLIDIDHPERAMEAGGRELMEEGLRVEAPRAPSAMIMTYRRR